MAPTANAIKKQINLFVSGSGGAVTFKRQMKAMNWTKADIRFLAEAYVAERSLTTALFPRPRYAVVATARDIFIASKSQPSRMLSLFYPPLVPPITDRCTGKVLTGPGALREARKLVSKIAKGRSFFKLAEKCSDDRVTSASGGRMLGYSGTTSLYPYAEAYTPAFEAAIFRGAVGKVQLVRSPSGAYSSGALLYAGDPAGDFLYGCNIVEVGTRHRVSVPGAIGTQIQSAEFSSWITQQALKANVKVLAVIR